MATLFGKRHEKKNVTPTHQIYLTCEPAKYFPKPCEKVSNVVASCGDQIDLLHQMLLHLLPNFNNCNVSPTVSDADYKLMKTCNQPTLHNGNLSRGSVLVAVAVAVTNGVAVAVCFIGVGASIQTP